MNLIQGGIKVFAPATVSNVGCGFDILGFAIDGLGDEIIIKPREKKGLIISKITGDKGKLPKNIQNNTAGVAARAVYEHLRLDIGLDMEIRKKMPFGTGLGSSAASAVAGAMAVNEILKRPLTKKELLPFAMKGEQSADGAYHADNVAPSLMGGMILIRDNSTLDVHRLYIPKGLYVAVVMANIQVLTKESRAILKDTITLKQHIQQSGNMASLVLGLINSDLDLIQRSLTDVIIEPQRAQLIPYFYEVQEAALMAGALGCSISGAGPSIFALCKNSLDAENIGKAMQAVYNRHKIKSRLFLSGINMEGAKKC
jgi:homoserine kinase